MKKTVEIHYGRSLKINKGNYEQDSPMWNEKVIIEFNGENPEDIELIKAKEYDSLKKIVDERALLALADEKTKLAKLRVREKDGKKYPSVTSIINPEPYTGDPDYGVRGTEIERIINVFIDTGEWEEPKEPLRKIKYDGIDYKKFFVEFGKQIDFKKCERQVEVFNDTYMYSGAIDIICKVDKKLSLCDWKTGGWKWQQLIAYQKAVKSQIEQLVIFDLKNMKLEILDLKDENFQKGWETFLVYRGIFKGRFGL